MKITLVAFLAASILCGVGADANEAAKFKLIHAADLVAELQKNLRPTILDADNENARNEHGIIPGAQLLSSSGSYDVARELPSAKDAELIFYCANSKCMASRSSAARAAEAGYTNVAVLDDGIQGWKAAGQKTEEPHKPPARGGGSLLLMGVGN